MLVDRSIAPFFDIALTLRRCVMCELCGQLPASPDEQPASSEEAIYAQAADMQRHGWRVIGPLEVLCPRCVAGLQAVA